MHNDQPEFNVIKSTLANFSDIVLVSKRELEDLQNRVKGLLEANNNEVQKRRDAEANMEAIIRIQLQNMVKTIIGQIQFKDKLDYIYLDYIYGGSCGDGSFEYKQRSIDHNDRLVTIKVLKRDILDEG